MTNTGEFAAKNPYILRGRMSVVSYALPTEVTIEVRV